MTPPQTQNYDCVWVCEKKDRSRQVTSKLSENAVLRGSTNIWLRKYSWAGIGRHFVNRSARCSRVGTYNNFSWPELHCWRRKWARCPMCREFFWSTALMDCLIVDWLSHLREIGPWIGIDKSWNMWRKYAASFAASAAAYHSDSVELWATTGWRCEHQLTRFGPTETIQPVVDR